MDLRTGNRASAGWARGAAAVLLAVVGLLASAAPAGAQGSFGPPGVADVPRERLFDLGIADPDGDGFMDMFTTNHKFHQALLHNDGNGNFTDVTGPSGLSPSPAFPGYERLRAPVMDQPGVYVYATDSKQEKLPGRVHIRAVGIEASGSISFGADSAVVLRSDGAQVKQSRTGAGQPIVDFSLDPGAVLDIQPSHIDLPSTVSIDEPIQAPPPILPPPLGPVPEVIPNPDVFVGTDAVSAPLDFILDLKDRHGFVFADLGGDGATDVFAVSGGLGGVIKLPGFRGKVQDEFLLQQGSRFVNATNGSGLNKDDCRGRQVAAVDFDQDGQLDLFEGCEGDVPNVYRQTSRGQFGPIEPPDSVASTYRWVTLGAGSEPSLLAAEKRGTRVYDFADGEWRVRQSIRGNARNGEVAQYAVSDVDGDGDLDVLAVSRGGNTFFRNENGRLAQIPLDEIGLPPKSVAASFVDYDNDGRVDLQLVPQGILRGVGKGRFRNTGKLRTGPAGAGITNWIDYDNDGLRDPVTVTGNAEFAKRMKVERAKNLGPGGHWLQVDLRGRGGNHEAIGARAMVRAGNRQSYGWVGQFDDAHFSQGHYRMYFGLGPHTQVGRLVIRWPNGDRTRLGPFPADQIVEINQP